LILDTSTLPNLGKCLENQSFIYDNSQGKTVKGYEILTPGLLIPRNFYPVNFGHHLSQTAPVEVREARPLKARGNSARRRRDAKLTKPALAVKMLKGALAQGFPAYYLSVDAWFTSPTFCRRVQDLGLQIIGRLKRDRTLYYRAGLG
jgi:hypothetical protein